MKMILNSTKKTLIKYKGQEIKFTMKLSSLDVSSKQLYKAVTEKGDEIIVSENDYQEVK